MTKLFFLSSFILSLFMTSQTAAQSWESTQEDQKLAVDTDSISKTGYTLIWINKDPNFDPALKKRLIDTYFLNYPKLAKAFNSDTRKQVTFVIDPDYQGVAATAGGIVRFSPAWFAKNPSDIDVVTHEVMHIVQDYPSDTGPWWITEGIADYVRFKYGVANAEGNWSLPEFDTEQKYTDSYRTTARFFHWLVIRQDKKIIRKLDDLMRQGAYSPAFWKERTGKSIDELWREYANNPSL